MTGTEAQELAQAVPRVRLEAGTVLYRVHRSVNGPIYFSHSGAGRFDPPATGRTEFGTCYFGLERLTTFVEVFGRTNPIPEPMIDERSLTEIRCGRSLVVADLTARTLLGHYGHPVPEYSVGSSYRDSQRLAAALFADGVEAVRYAARHDPALQLLSLAVFSNAKAALTIEKTTPIPDDLSCEAEQTFALYVVPESPIG